MGYHFAGGRRACTREFGANEIVGKRDYKGGQTLVLAILACHTGNSSTHPLLFHTNSSHNASMHSQDSAPYGPKPALHLLLIGCGARWPILECGTSSSTHDSCNSHAL